ncbi:MAG: molybdate ABC transporter substrate-binding protein [Pseudomonadota bacterium]
MLKFLINTSLINTSQNLAAFAGLVAAVMIVVEPAFAARATIAVAANFKVAAERLRRPFEEASGHHLTIVTGATGQIFAQIKGGAPFDVFLSADSARPARLEAEGLIVPGTRFTYAIGRLIVWAPGRPLSSAEAVVRLMSEPKTRIAIANPKLAPYGAAAERVLNTFGIWAASRPRLVMGQNIGQTFAMVATGNVPVGFLALSQMVRHPAANELWMVPSDLHDPIRQDAVLLRRAASNAAAQAYMTFLRSRRARRIISDLGYETD